MSRINCRPGAGAWGTRLIDGCRKPKALFETLRHSVFASKRHQALRRHVPRRRSGSRTSRPAWLMGQDRPARRRRHLQPLTPAMEQAITEGYEATWRRAEEVWDHLRRPTAASGRGAGTAPTSASSHPSKVHVMRDELYGGFAFAQPHHRPGKSIVKACRARDEAIDDAVPWHAYIASHPELQSRVAR